MQPSRERESSVRYLFRILICYTTFGEESMPEELFSGLCETGWDQAPWELEPVFSADELQILLNPALSAAEAADRVGCVEHDVVRLRRTG